MTRFETEQFLADIRKLYPRFHADGLDEYVIGSWHEAFRGYRPDEARAALQKYFAENTSGYAPKPGNLKASFADGWQDRAGAKTYGCGYCRENGHGDGMIRYTVPVGKIMRDGSANLYAYEAYTDCLCQLEVRGSDGGRIARQKAYIKTLADEGLLAYAYTSQELPEYEDVPF